MARSKKSSSNSTSPAIVGFEAERWAAAEYKHVMLGLIFLKRGNGFGHDNLTRWPFVKPLNLLTYLVRLG